MDQKKTEKRPTVGHLLNELNKKPFDVGDATAFEITNPLLAGYEQQFTEQLNAGKEKYPNSDFFMEVHLLVPKVLHRQVFRFVMVPRKTLPVPTFDQSLYRYHHQSGDISLVWVIPSIENCALLYEHRDTLPAEFKDNLKYVMHFKEGTLFRDMYKLYNQER